MLNKSVNAVLIAVISMAFCQGAAYGASFGDLFGGNKAQSAQQLQDCQMKVNQANQKYQQIIDEMRDTESSVQALREKNSTLMESYEKLLNDQSNMTEQLNRLRREGQKCEQVEQDFDSVNQENQAFLQANESLELDKMALTNTLETLKSHIGSLTLENERLSDQLKEAQEDESVKMKKMRDKVKDELESLRTRTASLSKENDVLAEQLKGSQSSIRSLNLEVLDLQDKLSVAKDDLAAMDKDYMDLKDENQYLTREASEFPKRFTDLARHNRKLVKETTHMHYNMGVSFIKSKEYKRAEKEFKKVLELDPNDPYANYNLGYIYAEHLVDRPAAVKYFQNYLTYAKDAKDADWVKKYIMTWETWYGKSKLK